MSGNTISQERQIQLSILKDCCLVMILKEEVGGGGSHFLSFGLFKKQNIDNLTLMQIK